MTSSSLLDTLDRMGEALLIALLGLVCTVVCAFRLCAKVLTIGLIPRGRFIEVFDDAKDSVIMTGYGVAHVFVPMF